MYYRKARRLYLLGSQQIHTSRIKPSRGSEVFYLSLASTSTFQRAALRRVGTWGLEPELTLCECLIHLNFIFRICKIEHLHELMQTLNTTCSRNGNYYPFLLCLSNLPTPIRFPLLYRITRNLLAYLTIHFQKHCTVVHWYRGNVQCTGTAERTLGSGVQLVPYAHMTANCFICAF